MSTWSRERELRQATRGQRPGLRREAATLRALRPLDLAVEVIGMREDDELTVLITSGGPSLRDAVQARPERFGVLASAFTDTLARLHAAGWAHGALDADACVVAGRSRVLLRTALAAVHGPDRAALDDDLRAATAVLRDLARTAAVQRSQRRSARAVRRALDRHGAPASADELARTVASATRRRSHRRPPIPRRRPTERTRTARPTVRIVRVRRRGKASDPDVRRAAAAGATLVATAVTVAALVSLETNGDALAAAGRIAGVGVLCTIAVTCGVELVRVGRRRLRLDAGRRGPWPSHLRPALGLGGLSALVAVTGGSNAVASPTGEGDDPVGPPMTAGPAPGPDAPPTVGPPGTGARTYLPWASDASTRGPTPTFEPSDPAVTPVVVPVPPPDVATSALPSEHVVGPGDHLWGIAEAELERRLGRAPTDTEIDPYWRAVIEANRDRLVDRAEPDIIFPGQRIALP
jgi:hypothetical protein